MGEGLAQSLRQPAHCLSTSTSTAICQCSPPTQHTQASFLEVLLQEIGIYGNHVSKCHSIDFSGTLTQFLKGRYSSYRCCPKAPCSRVTYLPGEAMLLGIAALHARMAFVSSELIPGIWGSAVAVLPAWELGSSLICRGVQVVKTAPVLTGAGPLRAGQMLSSGHKASTGYTNLCVLLLLIKNLTGGSYSYSCSTGFFKLK